MIEFEPRESQYGILWNGGGFSSEDEMREWIDRVYQYAQEFHDSNNKGWNEVYAELVSQGVSSADANVVVENLQEKEQSKDLHKIDFVRANYLHKKEGLSWEDVEKKLKEEGKQKEEAHNIVETIKRKEKNEAKAYTSAGLLILGFGLLTLFLDVPDIWIGGIIVGGMLLITGLTK